MQLTMNICVIQNKSNSISTLNIIHKIIKTHFKKLNISEGTMNLMKSHKINFKQRKHFSVTCTYLE